MLKWISQNYQMITALTGIGTLLVWIVYLQVFVSSYRRQLRPKILITRGAGDGLEARCFISNMSSDPVYVQSIIVTLELKNESWVCPVTDLLDLEDEEAPSDPRGKTRQGPLRSADLNDIGSFLSLVRHVLRQRQGRNADLSTANLEWLRAIKIEVLGVYGSEGLLIGARRRFFFVVEDSNLRLRADQLSTEQITKRGERRRLMEILKQDP
jgi:hypothetical protein